jgi:hypothetical protein
MSSNPHLERTVPYSVVTSWRPCNPNAIMPARTGCPLAVNIMNNTIKFENIITSTMENLKNINRIIHDEYFELRDIIYNKNDKSVTIPYRRIFHEGPRKSIFNLLIFKLQEVDVIRSLLTIRNVTKFITKDIARIGTYSFNNIIVKDGKLTITCNEPLEISMDISKIDIYSKDINIVGKARISCFLFFIESNSVPIINK